MDACALLNEPTRATAKVNWEIVREIRARASAGTPQHELVRTFNISRPLCCEIVRGGIWNPDAQLTVGDEMRDRIIGALDTGCRRGEMLKIQNKHVDWQRRWIRILKENSKTEVARIVLLEAGPQRGRSRWRISSPQSCRLNNRAGILTASGLARAPMESRSEIP